MNQGKSLSNQIGLTEEEKRTHFPKQFERGQLLTEEEAHEQKQKEKCIRKVSKTLSDPLANTFVLLFARNVFQTPRCTGHAQL
ncbi:hypothetical protein TNCT_127511 [Trichonephila clavata]|uniref:Uncharacterized protein n=1 Tax=Trichonephila clavata TaxID=2740835 RepID=A0A8X6LF94_TRICU|nr:hypothetical protein TNCT_127511 [Trichonephila clavata]